MNTLFYQYAVLFLGVTCIGFGCIACALRFDGGSALLYAVMACVQLFPLYGCGKGMLEELQHAP